MLPEEYKIMHDFETNYWWYAGLHELILYFIEKKSNGRKMTILDAGCGTGRLLELMKYHYTTGFDIAGEAISFCKKKGLENITKQDINTWKTTEKFDIITSIDVICSIGIINYKQILNNFYKTLNNKGMLILNLPAFEMLRRNHDKAVFVKKRFRKKELKKDLINAGFSIQFITYRLPFLFGIIMCKKIYQKLSKNDESKSDLQKISPKINNILLNINKLENMVFKTKIPKLIGSSVFVVARKN